MLSSFDHVLLLWLLHSSILPPCLLSLPISCGSVCLMDCVFHHLPFPQFLLFSFVPSVLNGFFVNALHFLLFSPFLTMSRSDSCPPPTEIVQLENSLAVFPCSYTDFLLRLLLPRQHIEFMGLTWFSVAIAVCDLTKGERTVPAFPFSLKLSCCWWHKHTELSEQHLRRRT